MCPCPPTHTYTHTHGTTCPRCKTAHKELLCRATTHGIPRLSLQQYSLTDSRPRSPSNVETLEAVNDEKKDAIITHPAHHWHQTSCNVWKLHLPLSLLAQLCYQSSVPTIVGLFCRCARLLLCHCCVFSTSGLTERKYCPSVRLCAPLLHAEPGSGSSAGQSPIHRFIKNSSCFLGSTQERWGGGRTTAFVF